MTSRSEPELPLLHRQESARRPATLPARHVGAVTGITCQTIRYRVTGEMPLAYAHAAPPADSVGGTA